MCGKLLSLNVYPEFVSSKSHCTVLSVDNYSLKSYKRTDAGEICYKCTVVASLFLELIF